MKYRLYFIFNTTYKFAVIKNIYSWLLCWFSWHTAHSWPPPLGKRFIPPSLTQVGEMRLLLRHSLTAIRKLFYVSVKEEYVGTRTSVKQRISITSILCYKPTTVTCVCFSKYVTFYTLVKL